VEGAGGDGEEGGGAEWYTNTAPNGTQKFISPPPPPFRTPSMEF